MPGADTSLRVPNERQIGPFPGYAEGASSRRSGTGKDLRILAAAGMGEKRPAQYRLTRSHSAASDSFVSSNGLICRGRPISTGWNSTAAAIVHRSASAIILPMLDMPGYLDAHMLPNAT